MLAVKITPDAMVRILEDYDGLSVACYNRYVFYIIHIGSG